VKPVSASAPPASLRALLNRLIDYAGLFPPAKLDMATTVSNYAKYLKSPDSWMMGRLIVPVSRLEELEREAEALLPRELDGEFEPWQISALVAEAEGAPLERDLAAIEAFNQRHEDEGAGLAIIDVVELKGESPAAIDDALELISDDYFAFFEAPIDRDPRGLIAALVDGDAGAKVRTGGATADAYPAPEHLARFIAACAAANVPFKATAGLHHPFRHESAAIKAREFGFLNVFVAGCLAQTHELAASELVQLLEEESLAAFTIDDEGIEWNGHRIRTENIEDVREEFAVSFGSCSFDEPREGLRTLKLL